MKYNLRTNKTIQYVSITLLILVFAFASIGATPQTNIEHKSVTQIAISKYQMAQKNLAISNEEKIKTAIDAYFITRYEGQKLLQMEDFSPLLANNTQAWVKKEKDKRDVELYVAKLFNLKYASYKYTLDYDSIEVKKNKAIVQLRESHQVVFEAIAPEISKLSNLPHTLTLRYKKGAWVIYKDEYQDELSQNLDRTNKDKIKQQVDENYNENLRETISTITPSLIARGYSRTAALTYAQTHYSYETKNPAYFNMYWRNGYNGDCTNFMSQIIYAGAPKMNSASWYYKNKGTSNTSDDTWSYSWAGVPDLYNFLTRVLC